MGYVDFELEIGLGCGRDYPLAVIHSPAGEARGTMHFPFGELELENRLQALQIALLQSSGKHRQKLSPEQQQVREFGTELFDALLVGEVRSRYDVSLQTANQQDDGLRLRLRFHAPELAALPWEFMYDSRRSEYMCLCQNTPIVRCPELPQPIESLTVAPPLRVLGMVASPSDLSRLKIDLEKQRVEAALQDLQEKGLVYLEWLEGGTWRHLQRMMRRGSWHIFHFIGHGGFDRHSDEGLIALVDDTGKSHSLHATQIGRLLANHHSLRLVLLNTCEGARGSEHDIFSSTASILVRRGIPAVIAMQHEISDRAAIEFARAFYESLLDGSPVDTATVDARVAVSIATEKTVEWGTPVLYMRSPDGMLFNLQTRTPPSTERLREPFEYQEIAWNQTPDIGYVPKQQVVLKPGVKNKYEALSKTITYLKEILASPGISVDEHTLLQAKLAEVMEFLDTARLYQRNAANIAALEYLDTASKIISEIQVILRTGSDYLPAGEKQRTVENPQALIIEDDEEASVIFANALQDAGFESEVIRTGDKALAWLAETVPVVVVLDLDLPGVSEVDIFCHIRADARLAETRVIIATAHPELATDLQGETDLVLTKPVSYSKLRDLIKRVEVT
jgi:CheY-like chemotaxis protein